MRPTIFTSPVNFAANLIHKPKPTPAFCYSVAYFQSVSVSALFLSLRCALIFVTANLHLCNSVWSVLKLYFPVRSYQSLDQYQTFHWLCRRLVVPISRVFQSRVFAVCGFPAFRPYKNKTLSCQQLVTPIDESLSEWDKFADWVIEIREKVPSLAIIVCGPLLHAFTNLCINTG